MPKLVPIKPKKFIKILRDLGFFERDAEGSHVFFQHPDGRTTVVPVHNREISRGPAAQDIKRHPVECRGV